MKKLSEEALKAKRKYYREYARERRKDPENVKRNREYLKQWRKDHPENVENHNMNFWEKQAGKKIVVTDTVTDNVTDSNNIICVICDNPFIAKRKDSKYCSAKCKQKHYRLNKQK